MNDKYTFEDSKPLRDHACHGSLQSHGDAADEADQNDEEGRVHFVCMSFVFLPLIP
jgi:hypothetical protein